MKMHNRYLAISLIISLLISTFTPYQPKVAQAATNEISKTLDSGQGLTLDFDVESSWSGAFNGRIKLTNTTDHTIENWAIKLNWDHEIINIWDAKIIEKKEDTNGYHYILKNPGYNTDIQKDQSITFGFTGSWEQEIVPPESFQLAGGSQVAKNDEVSFEFKITSDWGAGYNGELLITNHSDQAIENWRLSFDFDSSIGQFWTAVIEEQKGNHYVIKHAGYNSVIRAGETIRLGFGGSPGDIITEPSNYVLMKSSLDSESDSGSEVEVDYNTDSDSDGLPNLYESGIGTDPFDADSDQDGLPDGYELLVLKTDPLKSDSDENGIADGVEDFDEDGLDNLTEYEVGTDPFSVDTDEDGLTDGEEQLRFLTDPLNDDTDGDTIFDGDEIKIKLNPLDAYTNAPVHDSEYMLKQSVGSTSLSDINTDNTVYQLSLEITGAGNIEDNIIVEESNAIPMLRDNRAIVGTIASIQYDNKIESGRLTFHLKEQFINSTSTLFPYEKELQGIKRYQIFYYNNEMNLFYPINTEYDSESGDISAEITQLGDYCLVDMEKWLYDIGLINPNKEIFRLSRNKSVEEQTSNNISVTTPSAIEINPNQIDEYDDISLEDLKEILGTESGSTKTVKTASLNKQADVVFVIDSTGSMGESIADVKANIATILAYLREKNITLHVSFVEYKDITSDGLESTKVHTLKEKNWFSDTADMLTVLNEIKAKGGGGDGPETLVDALGFVEELSYRSSAYRFAIICTDANNKMDNRFGFENIEEVSKQLKEKDISACMVSNLSRKEHYSDLYLKTGGTFVSLDNNFHIEVQKYLDEKMKDEDSIIALVGSDMVTGVLNSKLVKGGKTDTDSDGLTDSEEVNWDYIQIKDGEIILPTLDELLELVKDSDPNVLERFQTVVQKSNVTPKLFGVAKEEKATKTKKVSAIPVLPTKSHLWNKDSDGDGIADALEATIAKRTSYDIAKLKLDQTINRKIFKAGDVHTFSYEPDYYGEYVLETKGKTDTFLKVYLQANYKKGKEKLLYYDNDSGSGKNANITDYFAQHLNLLNKIIGGYKIKASHNKANGTGEYSISIRHNDIYKDAGFKEGDSVIIYAVNSKGSYPFMAKLTKLPSGRLQPVLENMSEYERFAILNSPQVTPQEFMSFVISFTPADFAKDAADFIAGKDVITGEEIERWILAACLLTPELIDQGVKLYGKNADKVASFIKSGAKGIVKLSESNVKHISKHIPSKFADQVKFLTDDQLAAKLKTNSFFNPKWSDEKVKNNVEKAYNSLLKKGLTGKHDIVVGGEKVCVVLKSDGTFDTAYGYHILSPSYFGR